MSGFDLQRHRGFARLFSPGKLTLGLILPAAHMDGLLSAAPSQAGLRRVADEWGSLEEDPAAFRPLGIGGLLDLVPDPHQPVTRRRHPRRRAGAGRVPCAGQAVRHRPLRDEPARRRAAVCAAHGRPGDTLLARSHRTDNRPRIFDECPMRLGNRVTNGQLRHPRRRHLAQIVKTSACSANHAVRAGLG